MTSVRVLASAGHSEFDKSAILFPSYRARYGPAAVDGVPVPFTLRQEVAFELEPK